MITKAILVALAIVVGGNAEFALRFSDVSARKGFLTDRRNKYWGATIADFDRDGRYDLLLCNHGDPAELYWSDGRDGFRYLNPGLNAFDLHSFAADDLDGDGDLDIVVVRGGSNGVNPTPPIVYVMPGGKAVPSGSKKFGKQFGLGGIGMRGRSIGFADFDGDGDNDLLYVNMPKINDTLWNVLYKRTKPNFFRPLSKTGLDGLGGVRFSLVDINDDGYLDVLVMTFFSLELYVNTFPETGRISFKLDPQAIIDQDRMKLTKAIAEIDCDNDGIFELVVVSGHVATVLQSPPKDFLLKRVSNGEYHDITLNINGSSKLPETDNHYGVTQGDFNNDGLMDLYISRTSTNGVRRQDRLYENMGNCHFVESTPRGLFSKVRNEVGESVIAFDYDMDGRIDILSGSKNGHWRLYRNVSDLRKRRAFIILRVGRSRSGAKNPKRDRGAMGAIVKVFCSGRVFMQRVGSPGNSHTQSVTETLHFGLGRCTQVGRIVVAYPGKVVERHAGPIPVNSVVTVGRFDAACPPGAKCIEI